MIKEVWEDSPKKENTLLDILFEHQEKQRTWWIDWEDEDLIGEFLGLFLAGTNTTSNVVSVTLFYLFKYPEVLEKVREEVAREFADPSKIDIESLNRMNYLAATLKEAMRHGGPTGGLF